MFFGLTQFEEQLSLRLCRAYFHNTPGLDQIILDIGANPPDRVGNQAVTFFGIKFLHGVNEADIAFLDKVGQFKSVIAIFMGNLDDKPQVGNNELFRRFQVVVFLQSHGQFEFFFGG